MATVAQLKQGQKGIIKHFVEYRIPIKLLEMGCLPGNSVELLHIAPLSDPLYLNVNGSHIAIRKHIAEKIEIELVAPESL
ncbi:FeoA family protein [Croceitalea dokdonensis DOKDO 023]|uniref:FeoA family protein n=1 Tax=Croceitalea dokdonensis DOKDO 023 TaxID=1300341 RepID=A0A0P7AJQ3_9FLAO|nr:FeoA family protein [Croceitalea dokdonensis]KPM32042.1 FeoA family protein [Croceitalea dokdonensis DOKDO 023]